VDEIAALAGPLAEAHVDALWDKAVRVLDAFLGGGTAPEPKPARREFWKR
jgi:hypothetical protein